MKITVFVLVVLLIAGAGCASPNSGRYEVPTYLPRITGVVVPQTPVAAGETAELSVAWEAGREPFVVTWFFGDDDEGESFNVVGRSHSYSYLAANDSGALQTVTGLVEVKDAGGNPVVAPFSFSVAPAP